jgi:hypothetical protein
MYVAFSEDVFAVDFTGIKNRWQEAAINTNRIIPRSLELKDGFINLFLM